VKELLDFNLPIEHSLGERLCDLDVQGAEDVLVKELNEDVHCSYKL
jgi:hypothetical protein